MSVMCFPCQVGDNLLWDKKISQRGKILKMVCIEFNCTPIQLKGTYGLRNVSDARAVYCYLLRKILNDTWYRIGNEIHKKHAVAIHHVRKIEGYIDVSDPIRLAVVRLETKIKIEINGNNR